MDSFGVVSEVCIVFSFIDFPTDKKSMQKSDSSIEKQAKVKVRFRCETNNACCACYVVLRAPFLISNSPICSSSHLSQGKRRVIVFFELLKCSMRSFPRTLPLDMLDCLILCSNLLAVALVVVSAVITAYGTPCLH